MRKLNLKLFVKNVIDFKCDVVDNVNTFVTGGMTTPSMAKIGGKYVTLTLELQNDRHDAHFKSTKEVFLRN